jgi:hypothetical protein
MPYGVLLLGAKQTVSAAPVLAGRPGHCTRLGRRSPGATTAPEGEDHVKAQASLGCNRNVMPCGQKTQMHHLSRCHSGVIHVCLWSVFDMM